MTHRVLSLGLLTMCALAQAESKAELALRQQLAQVQADLALAKKQAALAQAQAATQAALAQARNNSAVAQRKQASKDITDSAVNQINVAREALDSAKEAADNAERAALTARDQAAASANGTRSLIIVQVFTLLGLVVGFIYKGWEHTSDLKEQRCREEIVKETAAQAVKSSTARLDQIHTLVNSSLTSALQGELDSRRANLVLLEAARDSQRSLGREPSTETLAVIDSAKLRIAELTTSIADRNIQTDRATMIRHKEMV